MKSFWLSLVFLAALYLYTAPVYVADHDSAEFNTIAVTGGIAHPPGYPLLSTLQMTFLKLPQPISNQYQLSLLSIIFMLIAFYLCFQLSRLLSFNPRLSAIACLILFTSEPVWRMATSSEPFALNFLMASAIFYFILRGLYSPQKILALVIIWHVISLGISNHHSLALLLPIIIAGSIKIIKRLPKKQRGRALIYSILSFILGLWPLFYLNFANENSAFYWGNWDDFFPRLAHHILRRDYGTLSLLASDNQTSYLSQKTFFVNLPFYFSWVFLAVIGVGIWSLYSNSKYKQTAYLYAVIAFLMNSIIFFGLFNVNDPAIVLDMCFRFFMLAILFLLPFLALGLSELSSKVPEKIWKSALIVALVFHIAWQFKKSDRSQQIAQHYFINDVLNLVAPKAVIFTFDDPAYYGLTYGAEVLRKDKPVVVVNALLWSQPWYRQQVMTRLDAPGEFVDLDLNKLLKVLSQQHFVVLVGSFPVELQQHPSYPIGPIVVLSNAKIPLPLPLTLLKQNVSLHAELLLQPQYFSARPWDLNIRNNYLRPWQVLHNMLCKTSDKNAQECSVIQKYLDGYQQLKKIE